MSMSRTDRAEFERMIVWLIDNADSIDAATITVDMPPLGSITRKYGGTPPARKRKSHSRSDFLWWYCDDCNLPSTTGGPLGMHQKATGHKGRSPADDMGLTKVRSA